MDQSRLEYLFRQYADNSHTENERQEFIKLLAIDENADEIKNLVQKEIETSTTGKTISAERADVIFNKILSARPADAPVIRFFPFTRVAAAVVIVLILSVAGYFYFNNKAEKQIAKSDMQQPIINDIAPGGNKAVLTLANGKQIVLDSANNGAITQQGNTKIIKLDDGQLAYREAGSSSSGEAGVGYNTISTPKGGQYQIVLADGSKVWLNAASSLRFPASFTGKERNVELTGEGYFEIAKNAQKPFHVKVNEMEVEVLGTHFNVNAYEDEEAVKTTLLEGAVKINTGHTAGLLKPGQQAQVNKTNDIKIVSADVDQAVAWKNGFFNFSNADLQTVLRQLARWYDVDVVYHGNIPKREFEGGMQRDLNLSEVLKILDKNNVHFKIEGKKIVVTP